MEKCYNNQRGYIVLLTILLVGAVGLSIAVSIILIGIGQTRSMLAANSYILAKSHADACVEEALQQIRTDDTYIGTGSLSLDGGACNYEVIGLGGDLREVHGTGTVANSTRKIKVNIDTISPTINITSWQEVENF